VTAEPSDDPTTAPGDHTTLVDVLRSFAEDGWKENLTVTDDGEVRCPRCRSLSPPETLVMSRLRRLEGASDPDDMVAVLAMTCPSCGAKGAAVAKYGPTAGEGDVMLLRAIEDVRPGG
jgi:hypothetical protein